jgi:hypothetical protein
MEITTVNPWFTSTLPAKVFAASPATLWRVLTHTNGQVYDSRATDEAAKFIKTLQL